MGRTVIAVFLFSCAAAFGQTGEVWRLTLGECVEAGLRRSGAALNAMRDQKIAGERVSQARATVLPQLGLSSSYTRLDQLQSIELSGQSIEMGTLDNYSVDASIRQLLYAGGKVSAALKAARLSEEYAAWTKAETESEIVRDIRLGFYNMLLAREAVAVYETSVKQLESFCEQTGEKQKRGAASEFEVLTAKVRLLNEKPELVRARNNLELARENLRRIVGLDDNAFDVEGDFECKPLKVDLDKLLKAALEKRPACLAMEAVAALKVQDVDAAAAEGRPSLNAFFNYNGANSYRFVSFGSDWEWHWSSGLNLQWNIWDGGLTRAVIRQKKLELDKSCTDLDELKKSIKLAVRQACLDMKHAEETVKAGSDGVALAGKAFEIASARYKNGLSTYLELTDANLALSRAKLSCMMSIRDYMAAVARLQQACGLGDGEFFGKEVSK